MAAAPKRKGAATVEEQTLDILRGLLAELGSHRIAATASLHSHFDRDLGLGSLERIELLLRCEARLHRRLPDEVAQRGETPAEWVGAFLDDNAVEIAGPRYSILQPAREAARAPDSAQAWSEVLRYHAEFDPTRVHIHLLDDADVGQGHDITYGELFENATKVAAGLVAAGLRPNDTVAIMLPTCADFFSAFFGVMLAGGIAVPIYPPARPDKIEEYVRRQQQILRNAVVRFLIIFDRVKVVSQLMRASVPSLVAVATVDALGQAGARLPAGKIQPSDAFFIQYTSGSTGDPKGVVLTHANVLANVRGIGWAVQVRPSDCVVTWLPLYHDMGLIGSWLFSVYYGLPITVLSPLAFLSRPERWLWALDDSRGTLCPAPNFSYELCARKIADEAIEGLDLSAWRVAINAGEAVLPETLARFAARFAPYGFRPESFVPCYGLAESSVALTFPPINRTPVVDAIDREAFERGGKAIPADSRGDAETSVLRFVANGMPLPGHEVRVLDDQGREVGERVQGRLFFRGLSQTPGYFRNASATAATVIEDGWMDSGDLAYRADGELYITGRSKDLIIRSGRNIIPQEVEAAAAEVAGVRKGCVAAFGTVDPNTGTERLAIVAETRARAAEEIRRIEAEIIGKVDAMVGIPPDVVVLVPPQSIPKTSSGKIRRKETRSLYERGELAARQGPTWLQFVRLGSENFGSWVRLGLRRASGWFNRGGRRVLSIGIAAPAAALVRLISNREAAARIVRSASRGLLRLAGLRVTLQGAGAIAPGRPTVFIANRAAVYDPLALAVLLPWPLLFADSAALAALPCEARLLLKSMTVSAVNGTGFPLRGTLRQYLHDALAGAYSLLVFPESAIGAPAQLSRFRLDAFHAARDTGTAMQPIGIREAPGDPNAARNSERRVVAMVGEPIRSKGADGDLAALRNEVRTAIARLCG